MTHQKKVMNDVRSSSDRKENVVNNIASVHLHSDMIYMSRRGLREISEFVLNTTHVKSLYLEGNEITRLPEHFFSSLTSLVWLDLRNNELTNLPAGVGRHRCLKTLLLEDNPITELPPDLGNVITLKALSLRNCPLTFPPHHIVNQGLAKILQYLRSTTAELDVPAVEKLQLSDLSGFSLDLCEEGVDDADVRHFQELRHRMVQMERADLEQPGTLEGDREAGPLVLPNIRTNGVTRGIGSETQRWSRSDEIRLAAMRELKEKQWILEERKRAQERLWSHRAAHQKNHRGPIVCSSDPRHHSYS
ncbi:leucine-rich repeat-containing protein 27-like [Triplophysa dalaica]|uniref:leucine-rich repeat-containing protein 27-like n=1 Tax=Triplophysa dalaica TaxID=1582913 RepID=UPI0024DFFD89|nr:leucine-rich repeat-containing protein 27-like [Triplophysa dalaica]